MPYDFPRGDNLVRLLQLEEASEVDALINQILVNPLERFLARPQKGIRNQVVRIGFEIDRDQGAAPDTSLLHGAEDIVELLHSGSLIIDDIQDNSVARRGQQAFHMQHGMPQALNAGNWLYFIPFKYIEDMNLQPDTRIRLFREIYRTLLTAHYGQALDLGIRLESIAQTRVPAVIRTAMELKTGALMSFALRIGGEIRGLNPDRIGRLDKVGRRLGICLQMFDDIGNLSSKLDPTKCLSDIRDRRPSFIFAVASEFLKPVEYLGLVAILKGSYERAEDIREILERRGIVAEARRRAIFELQSVAELIKTEFRLTEEAQAEFASIRAKLETSYV